MSDSAASYTTRKLTPDDAEAFLAMRMLSLRAHPWAFGASPEDSRFQTIADARAGLAADHAEGFNLGSFTNDGELVAIAYLALNTKVKFRHRASVFGVFTAEQHRGKGIARQLMQYVFECARAEGAEVIALSASERAHSAIRLYESLGFVRWGVEPDAIRIDGESAAEIYLQRTLS